MRIRNFMRPAAIGLSANGCDPMPGTPLGGYFTSFYVVLPFVNLNGDLTKDYIADVITALTYRQ
jgi:hypothetical protein